MENLSWQMLIPLVPLVLIALTGFYFKRNPPKEINPMMGYRTKRSKKSQEAWDFAQIYSSQLLSTWSVAGIVGLIIQIFIQKSPDPMAIIATSTVLMIVIVIGTVYFTEKELKDKF